MNENEGKNIRLTEFDYQLADPRLQMMKAAIPYLPAAQQRFLAFMIRVQETRRTMELFREGDLSATGLDRDAAINSSPVEMLQAMKPYAGPKERDMIEMLENIQIMMQAMQSST